MNALAITIIIVLMLFAILGYKRGLFRSVFKLVLTGLSFVLAYLLTPFASGLLIQYTNIDDYIRNKIYAEIEKNIETRVEEELTATLGYVDSALAQEMTGSIMASDPTRNEQVAYIYGSGFPQFVKDALISNNNDEIKNELGVQRFYDYISTYISCMIVNAIAFVLISIILRLIFGIIGLLVGLVVQLPIISSINRVGGIVFGIFEGVLLVWIIFVIISVFGNTAWGMELYEQIESNDFLRFLYDKNVFLTILTNLRITWKF